MKGQSESQGAGPGPSESRAERYGRIPKGYFTASLIRTARFVQQRWATRTETHLWNVCVVQFAVCISPSPREVG